MINGDPSGENHDFDDFVLDKLCHDHGPGWAWESPSAMAWLPVESLHVAALNQLIQSGALKTIAKLVKMTPISLWLS